MVTELTEAAGNTTKVTKVTENSYRAKEDAE